jgi:hypothetical protein
MSYFGDLKQTILDGQLGKNKGHSLGMPRLDRYISLRKKMFYVIVGSTGSGKSSLLYDTFILNPLEALLLDKESDRKLKYILLSMERSKSYIHAKWLIRRIFLDTGRLIPMHTLLNWYGDKLTGDAIELIDTYEDYFLRLEEHIDIYEGGRSPNDIFRIAREYAETHGREEKISEYKKIYVATDEHEEVIFCADHLGLCRTSKDAPTKKQAIDKTVETLQYTRDYLGWSDIAVNQLNRDLSNSLYSKLDSFEPHLDNAKETGNTAEAADVVLSLFDPIKFNTNDKYYGNVDVFRNPENGQKTFRNIKILKNSYGSDDVGIGTVFHGETGIFRELPKSKFIKENWKQEDYDSIFDGSYFLNK